MEVDEARISLSSTRPDLGQAELPAQTGPVHIPQRLQSWFSTDKMVSFPGDATKDTDEPP